MKWSFSQNHQFQDLVEIPSAFLRPLLDLQFRSLLLAERQLLARADFRSIKILDFGAGEQGFTQRNHCGDYKTIDPFFPATWKSEEEIPAHEKFDLIVSTEVFEHLARPQEILKNLSQHQNTGQKIYITTPFMAREHGAPDDYQRWTEMGMQKLLEEAGYRVEKIIRRGNLASVLSSFLNYKLFKSLTSVYFPLALVAAPFVFMFLLVAHVTISCNNKSSTYLGLSVLASKI